MQGRHRTQGCSEGSLRPPGPDLGSGFLFAVGPQLLSAHSAKVGKLG